MGIFMDLLNPSEGWEEEIEKKKGAVNLTKRLVSNLQVKSDIE